MMPSYIDRGMFVTLILIKTSLCGRDGFLKRTEKDLSIKEAHYGLNFVLVALMGSIQNEIQSLYIYILK